MAISLFFICWLLQSGQWATQINTNMYFGACLMMSCMMPHNTTLEVTLLPPCEQKVFIVPKLVQNAVGADCTAPSLLHLCLGRFDCVVSDVVSAAFFLEALSLGSYIAFLRKRAAAPLSRRAAFFLSVISFTLFMYVLIRSWRTENGYGGITQCK